MLKECQFKSKTEVISVATFKDRFRELVDTSDYDSIQLQLYTELGISKFRYYNWQYGRGEPDTEMLKKLAVFFNVSLEYLLGASGVKKPSENPDQDLPSEAIKQLEAYRELLRLKYGKRKE